MHGIKRGRRPSPTPNRKRAVYHYHFRVGSAALKGGDNPFKRQHTNRTDCSTWHMKQTKLLQALTPLPAFEVRGTLDSFVPLLSRAMLVASPDSQLQPLSLHPRTDFYNLLSVNWWDINGRDILSTQFQSRFHTQLCCQVKPFSTAIRMRDMILSDPRHQHKQFEIPRYHRLTFDLGRKKCRNQSWTFFMLHHSAVDAKVHRQLREG